jgi:hypothetical protein
MQGATLRRHDLRLIPRRFDPSESPLVRMSARQNLKYYWKGRHNINMHSNEAAEVLQEKRLARDIRMPLFPK